MFDPVTENGDVVVLPFALLVAVTVLVLEVAVTPAATGHRLIAAARFEARVVVLELVGKVPAVALPHEFVPLVPAVTPPQAKMLVLFVAATAKEVMLLVV